MFHPTYYVTVLTVCLGASTQFYSFGIINPVQELLTEWINQTYIRRNGSGLDLTGMNIFWSFVVSSVAIGAIVGALLVRRLSECLGRRNAIIVNGWINVVGALLEYFSRAMASPELLIFGRLVLGAVMGLTTGLVPMYLMEITPTKYRGAAGTFHMVAVAFSDWFSLFIGLPEVLGNTQNWPLAFAFPGIPAFLLCCILPFCPESPKFTLFTLGDASKAVEDFKRFVDDGEAEYMFESLEREAIMIHEGPGTYKQIFTEHSLRVPLLISIMVMITQQFTGCSAVFAYSTDMFLNAGITGQTARFSTLAVGIAYFLFALSAPFLIERAGRRILLIFQLAMCSLSLTLLKGQYNWAGYATVGALIIYMCVYGIGCAIPWLITGEIFPTKYRASAITVAVTVAWSLSFFVSTFVPFIIVSAFGAFFVYCVLPETRGKQALDIVREIRQRARSLTISQSPLRVQPIKDNGYITRSCDETTPLLRYPQIS
ncbi:MFS domain-containing protein [Meloidogyne graminicola]|uniref:MFS domain-containing protein n=1 Tax=Meloidogyne graminicola TaxID=189291 RepID=A0A8S9ZFM3_9BILA|nr:MFS domain-containing protein [Meloidogyne graminicola]